LVVDVLAAVELTLFENLLGNAHVARVETAEFTRDRTDLWLLPLLFALHRVQSFYKNGLIEEFLSCFVVFEKILDHGFSAIAK
jgi:hypothetical protein